MADEIRYRRILQAVCDTPWEILESKLELIVELLCFRAEGGRLTDQEIERRPQAAGPSRPNQPDYAIASGSGGNVAILTLYGVIMPRADLFSAISGAKGLNQFQQTFQQALADPSISAILLDVDSPGGQVDLVPETAAMIRAARGQGKPIVAIADTMAASAAYHIASQADELVVSPSGMVGSIGCLAIHQDVSQMLEGLGVTTTLVSYGDHKTDLYPYSPLSQDGRDQLEESVTTFGKMLEQDVAAGRGVSVDTVHNTFGQGKMFGAQQAVKLGMADRVDTLDSTIARLAHAPSRARVGAGSSTAALAAGDRCQATETFDGAIIRCDHPAGRTGGHTHDLADGSGMGVGWFDAQQPAIAANAVPVHSTDVVDQAWDGPGEVAKLNTPVTKARGFGMFAWYDENGADPDGDGYPDAKDDWKFEHHLVGDDGEPHEAVVSACRNGLARLDQAKIPDGDRDGVKKHLQAHIDDFDKAHAAAGRRSSGLGELATPLRETLDGFRARDLRAIARELAPTDTRDPSATPKGTET